MNKKAQPITNKKITIKYTCPKLTKDKVHTVTIDDKNLYDTWTSVRVTGGAKGYTHDLNAWADSLGPMDLLKVSLYPIVGEEDRRTCSTYFPCRVLDVKGDKELSTRYFKTVKHYGYKKNLRAVVPTLK